MLSRTPLGVREMRRGDVFVALRVAVSGTRGARGRHLAGWCGVRGESPSCRRPLLDRVSSSVQCKLFRVLGATAYYFFTTISFPW